MWFSPKSWNSGPDLYPRRVTEGVHGSLFWILRGVLQEYRVPESLLRAIWSPKPKQELCPHSWDKVKVVHGHSRSPCHRDFHRWAPKAWSGRGRHLVWELQDMHLCFPQMMWFCWCLQAMTFSVHRRGLKLSVKRPG